MLVVYKIEIVCILLKMVHSTVWGYARIEDMRFRYAPTIEPGFRDQTMHRGFVPNLNITATETPALYQRIRRNCSAIVMMQNPDRRGNIAITDRRVQPCHSP